MNHSTVTMIKQEPLSEDLNIVVDEQPLETENRHRSLLNANFKNRTSNRNKKSSSHFVTSTTSNGGAKFQQQTVRLTRVR